MFTWADKHEKTRPASLFLCDYLSRNPSIVQGKRVVELGAGVGAPGLAASVLGASHVTLTEQSPLHELLVRNIATRPDVFKSDAVAVEHLNWRHPEQSPLREGVDVVLISDCIFEGLYGESWRDLAKVVDALAERGHTKVLNCCERRNGDGIDHFLKHCAEAYMLEWRLVVKITLPEGEELELYEL